MHLLKSISDAIYDNDYPHDVLEIICEYVPHEQRVFCGDDISTILKSDKTLYSWRDDENDDCLISIIPEGSGFISVAFITYQCIALKGDGTIHCWEDDELMDIPKGSRFIAISSDSSYFVALKDDGTLHSTHLHVTPEGSGFIQVSGGMYHFVALKNDGTLQSWSNNVFSNNQISNTPNESGFVKVSAGGYHSVALKSDGTLRAWGHDEYGQVSDAPKSIYF